MYFFETEDKLFLLSGKKVSYIKEDENILIPFFEFRENVSCLYSGKNKNKIIVDKERNVYFFSFDSFLEKDFKIPKQPTDILFYKENLFTSDKAGNINKYNQGECFCCYGHFVSVTKMIFDNKRNCFISGDINGRIFFVEENSFEIKFVLIENKKEVSSLCLISEDMLLSGYRNGILLLLDLKQILSGEENYKTELFVKQKIDFSEEIKKILCVDSFIFIILKNKALTILEIKEESLFLFGTIELEEEVVIDDVSIYKEKIWLIGKEGSIGSCTRKNICKGKNKISATIFS